MQLKRKSRRSVPALHTSKPRKAGTLRLLLICSYHLPPPEPFLHLDRCRPLVAGKNGSKPCRMENKEYWVLWVQSVRTRLKAPLDPLRCPMLVEEFRSPLEPALRAREAPVYHRHETHQPLLPLS